MPNYPEQLKWPTLLLGILIAVLLGSGTACSSALDSRSVVPAPLSSPVSPTAASIVSAPPHPTQTMAPALVPSPTVLPVLTVTEQPTLGTPSGEGSRITPENVGRLSPLADWPVPEGKMAWFPDSQNIGVGAADGLHIYDRGTGDQVRLVPNKSDGTGVTLSPDGRWLAGAMKDGSIKIWQVASDRELLTKGKHAYPVTDLVFSRDGTLLASGSMDQTAKVWDVNTGAQLYSWGGHSISVYQVAISPDGRLVATRYGKGFIWVHDPAARKSLNVKPYPIKVSMSFSPDGRLLAAGAYMDGTIRLSDITTGREVQVLLGAPASVYGVAFSPDGLLLASFGDDEIVRVWQMASGHELRSLLVPGIDEIEFSPDGFWLATRTDQGKLAIWGIPCRAPILRFKILTGLQIQAYTAREFDPR